MAEALLKLLDVVPNRASFAAAISVLRQLPEKQARRRTMDVEEAVACWPDSERHADAASLLDASSGTLRPFAGLARSVTIWDSDLPAALLARGIEAGWRRLTFEGGGQPSQLLEDLRAIGACTALEGVSVSAGSDRKHASRLLRTLADARSLVQFSARSYELDLAESELVRHPVLQRVVDLSLASSDLPSVGALLRAHSSSLRRLALENLPLRQRGLDELIDLLSRFRGLEALHLENLDEGADAQVRVLSVVSPSLRELSAAPGAIAVRGGLEAAFEAFDGTLDSLTLRELRFNPPTDVEAKWTLKPSGR